MAKSGIERKSKNRRRTTETSDGFNKFSVTSVIFK
jgi:hypothetical protein